MVTTTSYYAKQVIKNISDDVISKLSRHDYVEENGTRILQDLTKQLDEHAKKISKAVNCLHKQLTFFLLYMTFLMVGLPLVVVFSVSQGQKPTISQILNIFAYMAFAFWIIITFFNYTLMPSKQYTKFIDALHMPSSLLSISKCYRTGQGHTLAEYFFKAMERNRKRYVWTLFGLPITLETYEKIISGLVSVCIAIIAYVIRGYMMNS